MWLTFYFYRALLTSNYDWHILGGQYLLNTHVYSTFIKIVVSWVQHLNWLNLFSFSLFDMTIKISISQDFLWRLNEISSVQSLSCVQLFATPWIAAHQASLSITNSQSSPRLTSIESVMPSSHLILCRPLLSRQEHWSGQPFPSQGVRKIPKDWTWVSCIAGGFFTIWATVN